MNVLYLMKQKLNFQEIYELYKANQSISDLAKKYQCTRNTIKRLFIKNNANFRNRKEYMKLANLKIRGENHPNWQGGIQKMSSGHIRLSIDGKKIIRAHKVYCEAHHLKFIPLGYIVHHINQIPDDDRLENLQLVTKKKHNSIHMQGNQYAKKLNLNKKIMTNDRKSGFTYKQIGKKHNCSTMRAWKYLNS